MLQFRSHPRLVKKDDIVNDLELRGTIETLKQELLCWQYWYWNLSSAATSGLVGVFETKCASDDVWADPTSWHCSAAAEDETAACDSFDPTNQTQTLSTPESTPQLNTFNVPTEPVEMPAVETVLPPEARRLELWDRGRKLVTYSDKSGETRLATWRLPRSSNDAVLLEASARKLYVCAHIHPKDRHVKRTYDRPDSEDSCDSDTDAPDYIPDLSRPQLCSIVDEIVSGCADRMRVDSAVLAPAAQTCKDLLPAAREHELIGTRAMAKLLMQRVAKICIEWSAKSMSDDS